MSTERNSHRVALVLFAVAVTIAMLVAFVTTARRVSPRHIRHLIAHRASRCWASEAANNDRHSSGWTGGGADALLTDAGAAGGIAA